MNREHHTRTWLCTVVFIDIIDFSKECVQQQLRLKDQLTGYIDRVISGVADEERVIMDTGDGAALCFLGDPEEALFCALDLRDILRDEKENPRPEFEVRIGINLGPAKLIKDINGQRNIIGDGINVAQRVMSFAGANQILVSRSFYEVIGCLSQEYEQLFAYQGVHKDKHVREHSIYEVRFMGAEAGMAGPTIEAVPKKPESAAHPSLSQTECDAICEQLSAYIGPMARVLVRRAAKKSSDPCQFCKLLAEQIDDPKQREAFLAGVALLRGGPPVNGVVDTPPSAEAGAEASVQSPVWKPEQIAAIEADLVRVLGPVARLLIRKASRKAESLDELRHMLAEEIPADKDRQAFLDNVH